MSKKEKKQPQLSLKEKRKLKQEKAAEKGVVKARKSSRKQSVDWALQNGGLFITDREVMRN